MDGELFLMLMVLWITTTYGLATFFRCGGIYIQDLSISAIVMFN